MPLCVFVKKIASMNNIQNVQKCTFCILIHIRDKNSNFVFLVVRQKRP